MNGRKLSPGKDSKSVKGKSLSLFNYSITDTPQNCELRVFWSHIVKYEAVF